MMSSSSPGTNQTNQAGLGGSGLSQPLQSRKSSIGLRRHSSSLSFSNSRGLSDLVNQLPGQDVLQDEGEPLPRRRSDSEPRPSLSNIEFSTAGSLKFVTRALWPEMSPVAKETSTFHPPQQLALPRIEFLGRNCALTSSHQSSEYNSQIVDLLDVVGELILCFEVEYTMSYTDG